MLSSQHQPLSIIVLVNKPTGDKQLYLDYRRVNSQLAKDMYPLPRLDELVEKAAGQERCASLKLKEAYYHIQLNEASRDLTFSDVCSLYRFRRLSFAPAIFSRKMQDILAPHIREGWVRNHSDGVILILRHLIQC